MWQFCVSLSQVMILSVAHSEIGRRSIIYIMNVHTPEQKGISCPRMGVGCQLRTGKKGISTGTSCVFPNDIDVADVLVLSAHAH